MTNKEKKEFILEHHKLSIEHHPYDSKHSMDKILINEKNYWEIYNPLFCGLLPKTFFKYRKPNKYAFQNFEKDEAWFCNPKDFDDTTDSTINNNIEKEIEDFNKHPRKVLKELAVSFVYAISKKFGLAFNEKQIDETFPLLKKDGTLNEKAMRVYLLNKFPNQPAEELLKTLKNGFGSIKNSEKTLENVRRLLINYRDLNKTIRSTVYTFSLAEEGNNQSMWSSMADESRGFCIEYEFPTDTFLGQRMLMNLVPIYYGKKPFVKFFDIIKRSLYSNNKTHGIDFNDYQMLFLSTFIKDKKYEYQNEWRITFGKTFGYNLQPFPFIKSVILGERMSDKHKKRIIRAAKKKKIKVYQRKYNLTESEIITERIL